MTISTNNQKVDQDKFNASFENIFGKKKVETGSFVMDKETGKCVPRGTPLPIDGVNAPMVMGPMKEFVSPIDQTVISSRSQLAAHNKKHGVTNASDYSAGYIEGKAKERIDSGQKYLDDTRRSDINSVINHYSR